MNVAPVAVSCRVPRQCRAAGEMWPAGGL